MNDKKRDAYLERENGALRETNENLKKVESAAFALGPDGCDPLYCIDNALLGLKLLREKEAENAALLAEIDSFRRELEKLVKAAYCTDRLSETERALTYLAAEKENAALKAEIKKLKEQQNETPTA